MTKPIIRTPVEEVKQKVASGSALLVCAYDDEQKFQQLHLEGAISLAEFKSRFFALEKDREIIFYCA
jgi:rhodanese-related sulfurtransferase